MFYNTKSDKSKKNNIYNLLFLSTLIESNPFRL